MGATAIATKNYGSGLYRDTTRDMPRDMRRHVTAYHGKVHALGLGFWLRLVVVNLVVHLSAGVLSLHDAG
ncbi:MAG: hypothetical protein ABJZ69_21215, partial [Hyphomicrobiales bacterium]